MFAEPSVDAFARLPAFTEIEIAPGGRYFTARMSQDGQYSVRIFEVTESGIQTVFAVNENDKLSIIWFSWVSSDHMIGSISFTGERQSRRVVKTEERRLFSLDATNPELVFLFRKKSREAPIQIQDRIVSLLPDDSDHILVQYPKSDPSRPGVYKVNIKEPGRHKTVIKSRKGVLNWLADADGEIRLGSGFKIQTEPYLVIRPKSKKDWKDFSHRISKDGATFNVAGFSEDPDQLYVLSNHEGDPIGLYLFDIVKDEFGPLIFKHPIVDVTSVDLDDNSARLLSVNFVEDDVATKRFADREIEPLIRGFHKQLGDVHMTTDSISIDGNQAVVRVTGDTDAGTYYLVNGLTKAIISLPPQYPDLQNETLGRTFTTEYVARDGLVIPAFITLPPGIDSLHDVSKLPFVIHPHGGPFARDFLRFDFRVQFLASRGYGVLQMNFRGSTGYGQEFMDAGRREWGQAMQDDITDGVKWLIDNEHADANRVAIVGGSYGGYAALMGAVKTPDLYRCAVSFAGVSDLPDLLSFEQQFVGGKYSTQHIGDLWKDKKMLVENSPARRADEIQIPVLLVHGDLDTVVDYTQSKKMAKQLRRNDKEYTYIELEEGDHYLSLYRNRLRYLQETEKFLAECLR